ncbi:MAG: hypothetical protein Q8R33_15480 [Burkholderiales bacterium]|nr:hypothetical protein [Burkholderiales bacterium]
MDGDGWQIRELIQVGTVWKGVFARLRDDAPHVVDVADTEHELDLDEGDRILDKCYFIYRSTNDVLTWQYNRSVSGLARFQLYLSTVIAQFVELPYIVDTAVLQEVLQRSIHELQFTYSRPLQPEAAAPSWRQGAFDLLRSVHGAVGKFVVRGERSSPLGGGIRQMVRQLVQSNDVNRIRVKLTDEADMIDLFISPIKDRIEVPMDGRYPVATSVFEELEDAYVRQAHRIPPL